MIEEIIKKLTLEEKALLFSGKTVWETFENERLKIPSIFLSDGPHGLRKQEGASDHLGLNASVPATCFPTAATLSNSWDEEIISEVGTCIGEEARANNVQVVLGPGLNIKRNPLGGRNFEYFSEDPYLSGVLASALVKGIQKNGTMACPKHFAVNNQELRRMASNSLVDERALREIYLTGFEMVIKNAKPKSIMTSYNLVNGTYANENSFLLEQVLRDEWGFDGFVVSDWGGDNNHVAAVKNGAHLQMPSTGFEGPMEIVKAVNDGVLSEEVLNKRLRELLPHLLSSTVKSGDENKIDYQHHHEIAKEAAASSIVLLKNGEELLPLNNTDKIAIIGDFASTPRYQGAGSSLVNPKSLENVLEIFEKSSLNIIGFEKGFERNGKANATLEQNALNLAENCDIAVLFLGLDELKESEGKDRDSLFISDNQIQLLKKVKALGKKALVILSAGAVVDMSWIDYADAILHGYLLGEAGASALADIVTGNRNPSGKLAESYPMVYSDVPFSKEFPSLEKTVTYKESLYVGYRYYDKVQKALRFPFGYGLSYTSFSYDNLEVLEEGVNVKITNTGEVYGEEIVQMYISNPSLSGFFPKKELKGFSKVGLAPGESRVTFIPFDDYSFRYFNTKVNRWIKETGNYGILIGANAENILLQSVHFVTGEDPIPMYDLDSIPNYLTGNVEKANSGEYQVLSGNIPANLQANKDTLLHVNSTVGDMKDAKSFIGRFIFNRINSQMAKSEAKGHPDLNLLFIMNMPFRAIAKMTNGMVNMSMIDGILLFVNGNHFKGLGKIISGKFSGLRESRKFKAKIN